MQSSESEISRSEYGLQEVLDEDQFKSLWKEVGTAVQERQQLVEEIYHPHKKYFRTLKQQRKQQGEETTPYNEAYQQWKQQNVETCTPLVQKPYQSALEILNNNRKVKQTDLMMQKHKVGTAVYAYQDSSRQLDQLGQQYRQKVKETFSQGFFSSRRQKAETVREQEASTQRVTDPIASWRSGQREEQLNNKDKLLQLAVQQEVLHRIKRINQQQKEKEELKQQPKQMATTCYVDLIQHKPHPVSKLPKKKSKQSDTDQEQPSLFRHEEYQTQKIKQELDAPTPQPKERRYKLRVDQLIQMPSKQFLIFYDQNYHQIVSLCSPQQMQQINQKLQESLAKQQALRTLQQRVQRQGADLVNRLPLSLRQKMFKVLYQDEVNLQNVQIQSNEQPSQIRQTSPK